MAKTAVAFYDWKLKGDEKSKALFCNPKPDSALVKLGFTFQTKNGIC
jgi:hypothetical protein